MKILFYPLINGKLIRNGVMRHLKRRGISLLVWVRFMPVRQLFLFGSLVDEKSILAETRMAPIVDPLIKLGLITGILKLGFSLSCCVIGSWNKLIVF